MAVVMKRYILFSGDYYYPSGGWNDAKGDFDTIEEAIRVGSRADWFHVIDTETWSEVA
jgi:hypothetical protein